MGKNLVIKGADFSENAVAHLTEEIVFTNTPVDAINFGVGSFDGVVQPLYAKPTTNSRPEFYYIDVTGDKSFYQYIKIKTNSSQSQRVVFTNELITETAVGDGKPLSPYFATTEAESFLEIQANTDVLIEIPANTKVIYIKHYTTAGVDTTPIKAELTTING